MDRGRQWATVLTGCQELDVTEQLTHKTSSHSESNSSELAFQLWVVSGHAFSGHLPLRTCVVQHFLRASLWPLLMPPVQI